MAATTIILMKDIFKIIYLNFDATSNVEKKKIVLDYVCACLQIDQQNKSLDFQEAVNAVKICLQTKFFNK
jgi:hypothetical protein